jgi:hypothetical protein
MEKSLHVMMTPFEEVGKVRDNFYGNSFAIP